ncbi:MAG: hypothetical protein DCF13_13195 [Flavobacteriaceae bacterium]|nr:MAG: hypothetical protein DCF13_13195 [Flavobacteriaceae bacterium]
MVLSLGIVFIQDLKFRRIHVLLPVLIAVFSFLLLKSSFANFYRDMIQNIVIFLFIFLILIVYMSVKNKKIINPFQTYFGMGDFLFYIAVAPLFITFNFILYFILSMLFSIIMFLLLRKKMKEETIPLAGFASLLLLALIASDMFLDFYKITVL